MTTATMFSRVAREVARIKDEARYLSGMAAVSRIETAAAIEQLAATWREPGEEAELTCQVLSKLRQREALRVPGEHMTEAGKRPWNWCHYCRQLIDADDIHDGSEVRCFGCRRVFVCVSYAGGGWKLALQQPTRGKS